MVSVRYLLNQLMDFDQTRIDTLLGEGNELIRFLLPIPNFQGHPPIMTVLYKSAISKEYLPNPWFNFKQTCIDILLGGS